MTADPKIESHDEITAAIAAIQSGEPSGTCRCGLDSISKEAGCSQCQCGADTYDGDPRKIKPDIASPQRRLLYRELVVGMRLKVGEGFTCMDPGAIVTVKRFDVRGADGGYYVECSHGRHYLDGDPTQVLEGFELAVEDIDNLIGRILVLATKGYEALEMDLIPDADQYFKWIISACNEAGVTVKELRVPPSGEGQ